MSSLWHNNFKDAREKETTRRTIFSSPTTNPENWLSKCKALVLDPEDEAEEDPPATAVSAKTIPNKNPNNTTTDIETLGSAAANVEVPNSAAADVEKPSSIVVNIEALGSPAIDAETPTIIDEVLE